ncbi:UNVERIFIED_CONTAM: hypothetical protein HDU68_001349 [Siphonaria sp. JEL0065]|nr:hypothetical protein HDU68_001349 [Siphonaria sp. JEL0065]
MKFPTTLLATAAVATTAAALVRTSRLVGYWFTFDKLAKQETLAAACGYGFDTIYLPQTQAIDYPNTFTSTDISVCRKNGVNLVLSIEGATGSWSNKINTTAFANKIIKNYFSPDTSTGVVLDGVDF